MYNIFILPLEKLLLSMFEWSYAATGSYGTAIVMLSVLVTAVLTPLYMLAHKYESIEKEIQGILSPKITGINKNYTGQARHKKIKELYERYGYSPVYSFRSLLSIFIQVPFFIAAYHMLSHYQALNGVSFLFIKDLGLEDNLFSGINLLPFAMTFINIISTLLIVNFTPKDRNQSFAIAGIFLIILYSSPAGLVLYWTCNNFINMLRNLFFWIKEKQYLKVVNSLKSMPSSENYAVIYTFLVLSGFFFIFSNEVYKRYTSADNDKIAIFLIPAICWQLYLFYKQEHSTQWKKKAIAIAVLVVATAFFIQVRSIRFNTVLALLIIISIISGLRKGKLNGKLPIFLFLLAVTVPCLHYVSANLDYFSTAAIFFFMAIFLVGFSLVYLIVFLCSSPQNSSGKLAAVSAFAILLMLIPILRGSLYYSSTSNSDYFLYSLFLFPLLYYLMNTHKKAVTIFLSVCFIYYASFIIMKKPPAVVQADERENLATRLESKYPPVLKNMEMKNKPNIYILVYDGIGNTRSLQHFGLGQEEADLRELLESYNFKVYDNTYTVGTRSLWSMTCTYDMEFVLTDGDELRLISSGVSRVNSTLMNNGYYSYAVLPRFMVKNYYNVNKMLPESKLILPADLDYALQVVMGIGLGTLDHVKVNVGQNESNHAHSDAVNFVIQKGESQRFLMSHFNLPEHVNSSGPCDKPFEKEQWSIRLYESLEYMKRDFESVTQYDPESIVVIMGDHGIWLSDCSGSLDFTKLEDITEDNIHDIIGTYVAIRWPDRNKAEKYDYDLLLNQDIFPVIFSYLYDSEVPLSFKIDRSFYLKGHRFLDSSGNFIPYGGKK